MQCCCNSNNNTPKWITDRDHCCFMIGSLNISLEWRNAHWRLRLKPYWASGRRRPKPPHSVLPDRNEFFMEFSFPHLHRHFSSSPVAVKIALSSCSAIVSSLFLWYLRPPCKTPSIRSQPIKLRTALPPIRIANATALNWGAQWNAGSERRVSVEKNRHKKKLVHENKQEFLSLFHLTIRVGNWTISKRHGAFLFNSKTLKCTYLYASANSENTAVSLKCKRVNNIRRVKVE